jgi:hypothetical protein
MQILTPAQIGLGVVQVHTRQIPIPNLCVKLCHCLGVRLRRADIVARRKEMAGIEADAHARFVIY